MDKSPDAFRTISEVAEALETPAHVLRFWESRFPQIRPVKRAGGRRYYRPADVALLTGIKRLLHDEGLTIRGVQKILREQGIRHVSGLNEEPSPEEVALEAAMALDVEAEDDAPPAPDPTPEEAALATATALQAALDVTPPAETPAQAEAAPAMPEPPVAPAPQHEPNLFTPPPPPPPPQVPPQVPPMALPMAPVAAASEPAPELRPEPAPAAPPSAPPTVSDSPRADEPTATLAARLRALPLGSLVHKQEPLTALAARLADLRARLSSPPHPGP